MLRLITKDFTSVKWLTPLEWQKKYTHWLLKVFYFIYFWGLGVWGSHSFSFPFSFLFLFNSFHATGLFLYLLKTSENLWFSDVFRRYRKRPMAPNGLMKKRNQSENDDFMRSILKKHLVIASCKIVKILFLETFIVSSISLFENMRRPIRHSIAKIMFPYLK